MNALTKNYRKSEFEKLKTTFLNPLFKYSEYKTKVKFVRPDGQTKWLDITNDEFDKIVGILTSQKN